MILKIKWTQNYIAHKIRKRWKKIREKEGNGEERVTKTKWGKRTGTNEESDSVNRSEWKNVHMKCDSELRKDGDDTDNWIHVSRDSTLKAYICVKYEVENDGKKYIESQMKSESSREW